MGCLKENVLRWSIIFHLKRILKRLCYYKRKKGLMQIIVNFRTERLLPTFLSCTKHTWKWLVVLIWKCKGSFQVHVSVHEFWKKVSLDAHFFHCGACMHQKSEQSLLESCASKFPIISTFKLPSREQVDFYWYEYVYTYRRQEIPIILERNYRITFDSCYSFTKKRWTWSWTWYW